MIKHMESGNLIQNSNNLCKIAEEIIQKTNVLQTFSQLGKVEIIGSLRLRSLKTVLGLKNIRKTI